MIKMREIWSEGYQISGNQSKATHVANVKANSFYEACCIHYGNDKLFNKDKLTYWGCKLFETEKEARKFFG